MDFLTFRNPNHLFFSVLTFLEVNLPCNVSKTVSTKFLQHGNI